jgi:hypothetical protein
MPDHVGGCGSPAHIFENMNGTIRRCKHGPALDTAAGMIEAARLQTAGVTLRA